MKRALFKIGRHFVVTSSSATSKGFELNVNVDDWRDTNEWTFPLKLPKSTTRNRGVGTSILIDDLFANVAESFNRDSFRSELSLKIEARHQPALNDGLSIRVNSIPVGLKAIDLLQGGGLAPAYDTAKLFVETAAPLTAHIYCGLGPTGKPREGGWYIYCNGRLVVGPDQSSLTGWGRDDGKRIPRYHNQFSQFRGYAFLESSDPTHLPWTTTKAGIDQDHSAYRWLLPRMIKAARPVIDFLNELDREKNSENPPKRASLAAAVASAKAISVLSITTPRVFGAPKVRPGATKSNEQNILYRRPTSQILAAKKALGVTTNLAVGELTFDYFYQREVSK